MSFLANYSIELRIKADIRRKEKAEKVMEFAERMRKVQKEAIMVLIKVQKEMKQQANKRQKEAKV